MSELDKMSVEYADREYSGTKELGDYTQSGMDVWNAARCGFVDGANEMLETLWRDAEKEQPKDDHMVLVKVELDGSEFIDGGEEDVCYTTAYYENGHWQFPDDWYYDLKVLLWMPIPKKGGNNV